VQLNLFSIILCTMYARVALHYITSKCNVIHMVSLLSFGFFPVFARKNVFE